jgi:hypothetical protein
LFCQDEQTGDIYDWVVTKIASTYPSLPQDPAIRLGMEDAQSLMDELWQCGLRPTEGAGSAGALAATQAHLQSVQQMSQSHIADLQKLVFDTGMFAGFNLQRPGGDKLQT